MQGGGWDEWGSEGVEGMTMAWWLEWVGFKMEGMRRERWMEWEREGQAGKESGG